MPLNVKRTIQNFMVNRCFREYSRELAAQQDVYDAFMHKQEEKLKKAYEDAVPELTALVMTGQEFVKRCGSLSEIKEDIFIVTGEDGVLNPVAVNVILSFFEKNPGCMLVYADEDVCLCADEEQKKVIRNRGADFSKRCFPNMKPEPSPETFLSYQYLGNVWAVRKLAACDVKPVLEGDADVVLYDFLLKMWGRYGHEAIGHIPEILYHGFVLIQDDGGGKAYSREAMELYLRKKDAFWGNEEKYNGIKQDYLKRKGIDAVFGNVQGYQYPLYRVPEGVKVSILIPSKDNPTVLENCITSIYEKSTYSSFEIIVVDNGSNEENRSYVEKLQEKYGFQYVYHPMEFNYSAMNNMAAQNAGGEIILLLNDDMEVVTPDWLERMVGQVLQEGIGAVGAKLLYPGTGLIQHVGVTNAVDGPVHKLLKKDDSFSYNRGRNKLVYNVLGVTGACLMVRKELFVQTGGLDETLKVAYNDVDFCFSLYEQGVKNVIRNDVVLYHHESLSRGADAMSNEKMERLKQERALLYRKHPWAYGTDPYEGANNSGGSDFGLYFEDEDSRHKRMQWTDTGFSYGKYPSGVQVGLDYCEKHEFLRIEDKDTYVIQGYAILPEADNCRYTFALVLAGKEKTFSAPVKKKIRPNMAEGVPNATNVEMTGFVCYIVEGDLPADEYAVGIYATDRCSRQRLFQETGQILRIEG